MDVKTVTIIGANGTMGRNIAAIFASFGQAKVYMVSRTLEKSKQAREEAYKSVRAESIKHRMIAKDYSHLSECISDSDLIFEACAENWEIKKAVHYKIAQLLSDIGGDKIICSGTSGLSITKLSELYMESYRNRVIGMHFFNPPYQMTLCELVSTKYTESVFFNQIVEYVAHQLLRTAVIVEDSPAFLGNRIGFQFINETMKLADKYKYNGGIDYIDAIFGPFTGRTMAPLMTANFVGLDVHKAIIENLYENTQDFMRDSFELPTYVNDLVTGGKLGRKTGIGLYKTILYANGRKVLQVYDIEHNYYRDSIHYVFPFVREMITNLQVGNYREAFHALSRNHSIEAEICIEGLLKYILYALNMSLAVGGNIHSADDVMAAGFNWCPPLAFIEVFGGKEYFSKLCKERMTDYELTNMNFEKVMQNIEKSKYDYRRFIKAKP